ncbi:MAG: ferritin family protein [Thiohalocapsa sp.]|uniref:ferritin-like domain-containing protein n=1 Tax=Thiohalocapsa sp. TaxID=2497641 RepID=UPI0025D3B3A5|nr:ferritin family protein [Thiohalocapsa sp.]MCG6941400.1 ferritin family protein [Thiohalocapsa sp.]
MKTSMQAGVVESVGELLAHALELEYASQAHYEQLADSMAVHHNTAVAELFSRLAVLSGEHAATVAARAGDTALPRIPPWEFKWECPHAPEGADCLDPAVSYGMSTVQAIELALHNERRGHAYYSQVATSASAPEARGLAAEMAAEEAEHILMLEQMLTEERRAYRDAPDDLDPPHTPA